MIRNKNKPIWMYVVLPSLICVAVLAIAVVFATPAKAITISQLNLEIVARPGETIEQLVQIYDESFAGSTVYPVVYNFTESPDSEGSALIISEPADFKPDRAWIKWNADEVAAAQTEESDVVDTSEEDEESEEDANAEVPVYGQEEIPLKLPVEGTLFDFPYRIVIPQDAEPGTHLLSLVFQLKPAERNSTDEGAAIYIGSNVATNIFLKVLGATIDDIDVDFKSGVFSNKDANASINERKESFQPKNFFLKPPVDFLVTVYNQGNTHQKPDGNIKIVNDLFGSRTEEIQVNEINKIILPDTDRTFEVSSFGQGFMFGKYRAKITLLYGDPLRPIEKEISFWIIPLIEILIVLGVLLAIIIIIIIWRRIRKGKRERKEKEKETTMRQQIIDEIKGVRKPSTGDELKKKPKLLKNQKKGSNKKAK
ncbi:hypothetical protein ACFL0L_05215 [Patescibacteria group bacterium]